MIPGTSRSEGKTHREILKSTAQIGGSSIINITFGIIRNKAFALLLGPTGMGLVGLYNSIADLTQSLVGLGIQSSGVRQIAEASGAEDANRIAVTAKVVRRISFALGVLGALLLTAFSVQISNFTFGNSHHAVGVALLAIVVFFRTVSAGQAALIQGMRRISDLARMGILAALFSTLVGIPLVYVFREQGIVLSMIGIAIVSVLASWWYSRRIEISDSPVSPSQMAPEAVKLVKLGAAFMASGFLTLGSAYAIRIIVLRHSGVEAAGLYQAAWTLGGLYTGFILQSMGADFYPRLTAASKSDTECNRLVNEQAQVSILLAGPGVIATLTFAPVVVSLFYSAAFHPAINLLRWICLGMMFRVVAWPMGFIVLAKGAQKTFFWTEVAATAVHVGAAWILVDMVGINGAGVAFFVLYVWHSILIFVVVRRLSGFAWSNANLRIGALFLFAVGIVFCSCLFLPFWPATGIGVGASAVTGIYALRILMTLCPPEAVPGRLRPWLNRLAWNRA